MQRDSKRTTKAFFQTRVDQIQSIATVNTLDEDVARHIRDLQSLSILGTEYEITACIAASDDLSRGHQFLESANSSTTSTRLDAKY